MKKKGFTLVEIIVATGLFAIVMTISSGALLSIVNTNRKSQALKSVMNNLNFALEDMSRNIRTGTEYRCGSGTDCPTEGDTFFSFKAKDDNIVYYKFKDHFIHKKVGTGQYIAITAPEVRIDSLKFFVKGAVNQSSGNNDQPRVLLLLSGTANPDTIAASSFHIQTTVSQRVLDNN